MDGCDTKIGVGMGYEGDHHCDFLTAEDQNGIPTGYRMCKVNPGHKNFLNMEEFKRRGPSLFPNVRELKRVWNIINRTVRVQVSYTSPQRPDTYNRSNVTYPLKEYRGNAFRTRVGTGSLDHHLGPDVIREFIDVDKRCRCLDCCKASQYQESQTNPSFSYHFIILTATHVIFDVSEAEKAVFEFYFDTDDRKGVKCVYGLGVYGEEETRLNTDCCRVICVTHDEKLAWQLRGLLKFKSRRWRDVDTKGPHFLVSHPHGVSKRISIGEITSSREFAFERGGFLIKLKRGLKVRVSGDLNDAEMIKILEIDNDDDDSGGGGDGGEGGVGHKTFKLLSDITISSPFGISFYADKVGSRDIEEWWTISSETQIVTNNGTSFILPHNPHRADGCIKIEFRLGSRLLGNRFLQAIPAYIGPNHRPTSAFDYKHAYNYTMAACPGSSGAMVDRHIWWGKESWDPDCVHFGRTANYNRTGLEEQFWLSHLGTSHMYNPNKRSWFECLNCVAPRINRKTTVNPIRDNSIIIGSRNRKVKESFRRNR